MTVFRTVMKLCSNIGIVFLHVKNMFFLLMCSFLMLLSNTIAVFAKNENMQDIFGFRTQLHHSLCGLILFKDTIK